MRSDLPAAVGERPKLVPSHACELLLVRTAHPLVDPGPAHRSGPFGPPGDHVDRRHHPEALEDRPRELEHRSVRVVEGDRQDAAGGRIRQRLRDRHPPEAPAVKQRELALELVGRHRQRGGPGLADGVVAEDEYVAHRRDQGSTRARRRLRGTARRNSAFAAKARARSSGEPA